MENYFQNIFPKISGSQEDNQISIFGCPHSFFGGLGHKDTRILLPWRITRLGLTQEIGSAREEGSIPLPGPVIVPILWNDFTKS